MGPTSTSRPWPRRAPGLAAPLLDPCKRSTLQPTTADMRPDEETCFAEHCYLSNLLPNGQTKKPALRNIVIYPIFYLSVSTNLLLSNGIVTKFVLSLTLK